MPSEYLLENGTDRYLMEDGSLYLLEGIFFDDIRQDLIDGFNSAQSEANGWNARREDIAVTAIVRTSDTVYTFILPAIGPFDITATESIGNDIPASALVGNSPISASPLMTITAIGGIFSINAGPGSYSITGIAASIIAQRMINAAFGSYSLSGIAASLVSGKIVNAALGSYSITGIAASLLVARLINAGLGSYSVSGFSASLLANRLINAVPGVYNISGIDATFVYVPITGFEIDAQSGTYDLTGLNANLLADRLLVLDPGTYNLSGIAAFISADKFINAEPGTYTLIGSVASTIVGRILSTSPGVYSLTGIDANLVAVTGFILIADSGSYLITGRSTRGQIEFDVFPIGSGSGPCPQIIND